MRVIYTNDIDIDNLPDFDRECVYNAFDVIATREVFDAIHPQLDEVTGATYSLSRALQGPTLEMKHRGVKSTSFAKQR